MSALEVFVGNTNTVTIRRLEALERIDGVTRRAPDDATVTVTVIDKDGVEVPGQTWPTIMEPVGESPSRGDYRAVLADTVEFQPNARYVAIVDAVETEGGSTARWEIPFVTRTRKQ
jgi:hypothetical protein